MPRSQSQRERILGKLMERGPAGVHSFEFYKNGMPRGAAVVHQLRKDGHDIRSTNEPGPGGAPGVRYVLHEAGALFPVGAATPQPGGTMYDPYGEAA